MTYQNGTFDAQLVERATQKARLNINGEVAPVIGPITVTMTRAIESEGLIICSKRTVQPSPILTRTGIAVDQDDRTAATSNYEVEVTAFEVDEFRLGVGMIVRHARSDVGLLDATGNVHDKTFSHKRP